MRLRICSASLISSEVCTETSFESIPGSRLKAEWVKIDNAIRPAKSFCESTTNLSYVRETALTIPVYRDVLLAGRSKEGPGRRNNLQKMIIGVDIEICCRRYDELCSSHTRRAP